MLEQNDSKEYDRLKFKDNTNIDKNQRNLQMGCNESQRGSHFKEGEIQIPASLSEKNLSSVTLLRYHQLKLKELVELVQCPFSKSK